MSEEFDIQKLLRVKRHEQPPPEYFQEFLREFHCRQREELLRQPLWRIALERMQAFFGELAAPRLAYAGATAAVLITAGVASYNILSPGGDSVKVAALSPAFRASQTSGQFAESAPVIRQVAQVSPQSSSRVESLAWNPQQVQMLQADLSSFQHVQQSNGSAITPRYVIDTRPVSYEPPSSF